MEKTVKVLQLSLSENIGGIATLLRNLYKQFDHNDIQFDFVTTYDSPIYREEFTASGSKIYRLPNQWRFIAYYFALKKIVKENGYKIIHVNKNSLADIIPFLVGKRLHVPLVIAHAHNIKSTAGHFADFLHYLNRPSIKKYITNSFACSEAAARWFFGKKYCKKNDVPILKNGILLSDFTYSEQKRDEIRKRLSLTNKLVIGHVGRFTMRKNHDFLLDIFAEIHKIQPESVLLLVGTGPLMAQIQKKAAEMGISDSVIFMGSQKNINEYYQAMDAFVLPSLKEDLPVVGIEAQASGLPLFVSDTIDKELEVTDTVKWLSLQQPAGIWADLIVNTCECFERKVQDNALKSAGYDITETAETLGKLYKSIM